jgi:branched-chain amino acid transport system substrate-binding protein
LIKANEQLGFKPAYGSTYALANPALPTIIGNALDGRIFFATHHPLPDSPDAAEFKAACAKISGCDYKNANAMTGYISADGIVEVLKAAVNAAGGKTPTREHVVAATNGLKFDTKVNKGISWTDTDFRGGKQFQLTGLKNNAFVPVQPFKPLPDIG